MMELTRFIGIEIDRFDELVFREQGVAIGLKCIL